MQLKAIVFDYGGVLCFHPPEQQVRELADLCRLTREQFLTGYWGLRGAYDRGDVTREAYWQGVGETGGQSYTTDEIARFSRQDVLIWVHLDQRMMDWTRSVRGAGIPTGLLSNLPRDLGVYLRDELRLPENFDHHTFSYELRAAKPEPAIYRHAVEGLGLKPEEVLFIDDRLENIEGAQAFGLRTIQFESPMRLRDQVAGLTHLTGDLMPVGTPPVILE